MAGVAARTGRRIRSGDRGDALSAGGIEVEPVEHRLCGPINDNWAGEPLVSHETILKYIRTTRTETGLRCHARLDTKEYSKNQRVTPQDKARVCLKRHSIRPELNYTIYPHTRGTGKEQVMR